MRKRKIKTLFMSVLTVFCSVFVMSIAQESKVLAAENENVFEMTQGGSIRIAEPYGLRFQVKMSADVKNKADKVGMLIFPADYLVNNDTDGDVYYESVEALAKSNVASHRINLDLTSKLYEKDEYWYGNGAIVNIKEKNMAREFVGIAYYEVDGEVTFADTSEVKTTTRSAAQVALLSHADKTKVYSDEGEALLLKYIDYLKAEDIEEDAPTRYQIRGFAADNGLRIQAVQYVDNVVEMGNAWTEQTHLEAQIWQHNIGYGVENGLNVDTYCVFWLDGSSWFNNDTNINNVTNTVTITDRGEEYTQGYRYEVRYQIFIEFENNLSNPQDGPYAFVHFKHHLPGENAEGFETSYKEYRDGERYLWQDDCMSYEFRRTGIQRKDFNYKNLGTLSGTGVATWDLNTYRSLDALHVKASTTDTIDTSKKIGINVFVHTGDVTTVRTQNTYNVELALTNNEITANAYRYPNEALTAVALSGMKCSYKTEGSTTTMYLKIPFNSFADSVNTDKIGITFRAFTDSTFVDWTYSGCLLNFKQPTKYLTVTKQNTFYLLGEEAMQATLTANGWLKEGHENVFENLATISATTGEMSEVVNGAMLFDDRAWGFETKEAAFLEGKSYVYTGISEGAFKVEKSGYVFMLLPGNSWADSVRANAENDGWKRIYTNWNKMDTLGDPISYYIRWCEAEETYAYGKYNIAVATVDLDKQLSYMSDLNNFEKESLELSVNSGNSLAKSYWSAEYGTDGVTVEVTVLDKLVTTIHNDKGMNDNVEFHIQAGRNSAFHKNYTFNFLSNPNGNYWLRQWNGSEFQLLDIDASVKNSNVYFETSLTESGWRTKVFFSYSFLGVTESLAKDNVRICPMIRNCDDTSVGQYVNNKFVTYNVMGSMYYWPNTWPVLNQENMWVRKDLSTLSLADEQISGTPQIEDIVENIATLEATVGELRHTDYAAPGFDNSNYCFDYYGFASELVGTTDFVYAKKGTGTGCAKASVTESGYVVIMAGVNDNTKEMINELCSQGWEALTGEVTNPFGYMAQTNYADTTVYYVKECAKGEEISITANWGVIFGRRCDDTPLYSYEAAPGYVTMDVDEPLYSQSTDTFSSGPSIGVTANGRRFVCWQGGAWEPSEGNYLKFSYSDDGENWKKGFVVDSWENQIPNSTKKHVVCDYDCKMVEENGKSVLKVLYTIRNNINGNTSRNCATWIFTLTNPDASPEEWEFTEHKFAFYGVPKNGFTVLKNGDYITVPNSTVDERYNEVYISKDYGYTWTKIASVYAPQCTSFDETIIVEKENGTLWLTYRTTNGTVYESFSFDGGYNWTIPRDSGIKNPNSRFSITRLQSGKLMLVYHDYSGGRLGMTVAISEDDGLTWENKLCLYPGICSYPSVSIGSDGKIYITFDDGRYEHAQTRYSEDGTYKYWGHIYTIELTEDEIMAGGVQEGQTPLLLVGDTYVDATKWETFEQAFATYGAKSLGSYDNTVDKLQNQLEQIVASNSKAILVNAGLTELNQGMAGDVVADKVIAFIGSVREELPNTKLYVNLAIINTKYAGFAEQYKIFNEKIKTFSTTTENVEVIDINDNFTLFDGSLVTDMFIDGFLLNARGYTILSNEITKATGVGIAFEELNIVGRIEREVLEYKNLGTLSGTGVATWNLNTYRSLDALYVKASTTDTIDTSKKIGINVFVHAGDVTTIRTQNTYNVELALTNNEITANAYRYPNEALTAMALPGMECSYKTEGSTTTMYLKIPFSSFADSVNTDKIGITFRAFTDSTFVDWTYSGCLLNFKQPTKYLTVTKQNTFYLLGEEAMQATLTANGWLKEGHENVFENLATISATTGEMSEVVNGAKLFDDRAYGFETNEAAFLEGKAYVHTGIGEGAFTVEKSGYVFMLLPGNSWADSVRASAESGGWKRIYTNWNKMGTLGDSISYYIRWCEAGETYAYGKYNIAIADPASFMATQDYRAQLHFSTRDGFMNDPNGLVYDPSNQTWHMFYQLTPGSMSQGVYEGTIVWGHAVSDDLINWEELSIAIKGDEFGAAWSGSCVVDEDNTSGFFTDNKEGESKLVAMYTSAGAGVFPQSLAYSKDHGVTWIQYRTAEGQPVLPDVYPDDVRDPKIFKIPGDEKNLWYMVMAGGRGRIFVSENLKEWTLIQELTYPDGSELYSECPDLYPLEVLDKDGNTTETTKWVYNAGSEFYVIGDMIKGDDGYYRFHAEAKIDSQTGGNSNAYAAQTYYNDPVSGRRITVHWVQDWSAPGTIPTKRWNGVQSFPLETTLKVINGGYTVVQNPVEEVKQLRGDVLYNKKNITVSESSDNILAGITGQVYEIEAVFSNFSEAKEFGFELRTGNGQTTVYKYNVEKETVTLDKSLSGVYDNDVLSWVLIPRSDGTVKLRAIVDKSIIETFGNDGEAHLIDMLFADESSVGMSFYTVGGSVTIDEIKVYDMKSIYTGKSVIQ